MCMINRAKNFKASPTNRHKKYNDDKSWLKTFTQWLSKNKLTIAIAGAVAILAPLLIMALFNKPIADDFAFFSEAQSDNPIATATRFYLDENGRAGRDLFYFVLFLLSVRIRRRGKPTLDVFFNHRLVCDVHFVV